MPIYEYECNNCKEAFEVFLGINEPEVETCPNCNGKKIKKLVSNCSFQLKGSGWYLTDYARKDKKDSSQPIAAKDSTGKDEKKKTEGIASKETASTEDSGKSTEKSTSTKDSGKSTEKSASTKDSGKAA